MKKQVRIKICGITTPESAAVAAQAGADFIGIVFAPESPRAVSDRTLIAEIIDATRTVITPPIPVGVFADAFDPPPPLFDVWREFGDWVQVHDPISRASAHALIHYDAIRLLRGQHFDPAEIAAWDEGDIVHAMLIDGPHAGSGEAFDHTALADMMESIRHPIFLAGGLTPENVGEAMRIVKPFAVDVSSGVERERGVKDHDLIRAFCDAVRAEDTRRDAAGE
ncbi:MAG: phosphoribosylanthranilate isomerase [Phycisphaerales bacterium]|nr:phosphoribosylanthranilate isomerase [Phycisphaerales bacterium]